MKKIALLGTVLTIIAVNISCSDSSSNNEEEPTIPDAFVSMEATGDENFEIEFLNEGGVADQFSVNGSWTSNVRLLQINILDVSPGWQFLINAFNDIGVEEGTYELNITSEGFDISSFLNADQTQAYLSIGGELRITNVREFERPGPGATDFIDGTFDVEFVKAEEHPADTPTMTITGEFSGVPVGSNFIE
ncbi:MAG: hypothetical protein GVY08_12140 [Bacteroidetes bacterium]|jgi:hypothetical protein|nr:hypothetical protein [Bacteroidota bacterium]